jgi:hypothetical protein
VTYQPSAKRMPVHFRHESTVGGPLRGAAFPLILPACDPAERAARPERPMPAKLGGVSGKGLKQTWDIPAQR